MSMKGRFPWASTSQYESFWAHYETAEKWRRQHIGMVKESLAAVEQQSQGKCDHAPAPSTAAVCSYSEETETDEPMEVDEEYLEFQRITLEHRKKREEQRAAEEAKSSSDTGHWLKIGDDEYVLADKIGVHGVEQRTLAEPDEREKILRKRAAARELYGNAAEKLMAMETAMDMHFNDVMRTKQPPLWPNIPLKF